MPLRFQSQLQLDLLPDEAVDNRFEVIMPSIQLINTNRLVTNTKALQKANAGNSVMSLLGRAASAISGKVTKYIPIVEEITFGQYTLSTDFTRINTFFYGYPTDKKALENVNITMFLDTGLLAYYYVQSWRDLIFNEEYEYYYPSVNYKKDIIVVFYGAGSSLPVAKFTLKGCFPIEITKFQLKYEEDPKRLRLTSTFSVDRIEPDYTLASTAIASTLASGNPLGYAQDQLLAQASLAMSESGNTGWNNNQ